MWVVPTVRAGDQNRGNHEEHNFNSAGAGDCIGGNQAAQGTCCVNIDFSAADWFNSVVATSSSYTFEFDNVAISEHNLTDVPEPAELGMFGFGLLLIGAGGWYRKRREA